MKLKKFKYKIVNNTNNVAIRLIKNFNVDQGIVIADNQKDGKGQYGKKWLSYYGNIFVSIFFSLDKINLSITQITKMNCLNVKKLLSFYYKKKITIKNPNDLLINEKKICGILQESIIKENKLYLIVGIGINLVKNPNLINYPTTNLNDVTNSKIDKKDLIYRLKKIYEISIPKYYKLNTKNYL